MRAIMILMKKHEAARREIVLVEEWPGFFLFWWKSERWIDSLRIRLRSRHFLLIFHFIMKFSPLILVADLSFIKDISHNSLSLILSTGRSHITHFFLFRLIIRKMPSRPEIIRQAPFRPNQRPEDRRKSGETADEASRRGASGEKWQLARIGGQERRNRYIKRTAKN